MPATPTLYLIEAGGRDEVVVTPVWSQDGGGPLASGYRHLLVLPEPASSERRSRDEVHLLGIDDAGKASAFAVGTETPWVSPVDSDIDLTGQAAAGPFGPSWDAVRSFVIGDQPHLLAYAKERGQFAFFPLTPDLRSRRPYAFRRVREPGPTAGFDTVEPIVVGTLGGFAHYMCYGFDSGRVVIYSLQVTATGHDGAAPLFSRAVWVHEWAAKWTRFAFFRLGGGVYFLKTNVGKLNVNIDHVLDDPSQGAVEVGAYLDLQDALDLDMVQPLTSADGDPGFVAYMDDGTTRFHRFHGDCQGWTTEAELTTQPGATHLVPLAVGDQRLLLVY